MTDSRPTWLSLGAPHVWRPYTQMKTAIPAIPVVGADGVRLRLADGRELLDGVGSWWTAVHGYNHPHIRDAVQSQLGVLPHVMLGGIAHEQAYTLARRLAEKLPGDLDCVFFSDSGSVAVEVAMKMAMQYFLNRGVRTRTRFVAFSGAYHGDTIGTMAVGDPSDGMHALFGGVLAHQHVVSLPSTDEEFVIFDSFLAREAAHVAAVLIEPLIQGAGGMRVHSPARLTRVVETARRHGVLVIFDEIFVGFGRTGTLFAMEQAGALPDIVCVGKALTGGTLPLAATVAGRPVFDAFLDDSDSKALMHGPTFMGNPLACAAANASLDLFVREPRLEQVARIEGWLRESLEPAEEFPNVAEVRVKGAMGVIELRSQPDLNRLKASFVEQGLFLRPFGSTLYTTPAYITTEEDVRRLASALVVAAREAGG